MQFDLAKFLLCRAVAENADPNTAGADQLALLTSMMNLGLVQSAVIASVLAQSQAPPPTGTGGATPLHRGRRAAPMAANSSKKPVRPPRERPRRGGRAAKRGEPHGTEAEGS